MSEEEEYEPTNEELLAILNDADLLKENGFQILPKGHIAMVLMEMGMSHDEADTISQTMVDRIFLGGWIYVQESQLRIDED